MKKSFKKIDATAQLTRLTEAVQQILSADSEIKEVVWKGLTQPRTAVSRSLGPEACREQSTTDLWLRYGTPDC